MPKPPFEIASIGECMIEMQCRPDGVITMAFGGDTFNTAAYMARLGRDLGRFVHYVTALGDDPFSDDMVAFFKSEGVLTDLVMRRPGKRPGLYFIKNEPSGERHFYYWRSDAAVRECFECPGSDELLGNLGRFGGIYVSGISLAVLKVPSRERLLARLEELSRQGAAVYFDCNYRPLLWEDLETTRHIYERMFAMSRFALITVEELAVLGVECSHAAGARHFKGLAGLEVVIKDGANPCTVIADGTDISVPALKMEQVVDTTAAGDSFSATYLLGRALGYPPRESAERAHRVGAAVVGYRGAIIPPEATPRVF